MEKRVAADERRVLKIESNKQKANQAGLQETYVSGTESLLKTEAQAFWQHIKTKRNYSTFECR